MAGVAGLPHDAARPGAGSAAGPRATQGTAPPGTGHSPGAVLARAARAPWHWLAGRTLRARLIVGLLALLAMACAVVGGATYFAANRFLLIQLDNQLKESASLYYQACLKNGPPQGAPGSAGPANAPPCGNYPGQAPGTLNASRSNNLLTSANVAGYHCDLTTTDKKALNSVSTGGSPHTVLLSSMQGDYRAVAVQGPGDQTLITAMPMASMQATLHGVELTELGVFAGVLLLAGVLGTGLVSMSLRPLRRVTATATRVTQLPLADGHTQLPDRVPDTNPKTEVGQVGSAFNRMLGHVESALARRAASEARLRRFAADASHELRTPLASIRGYAELARRHPGPVPDDVAHALGRVESEAARMSLLVDELLLLARLDAGRPLASEPVDLTRLAIDTTSDARAAGQQHRWVLELPDEPVVVPGDEHRLHQVLANLLGNARTHTPPGTTVTVRLAAPAGGAVQLSVTDDGPGIPQELQPDLFDRFVHGSGARSGQSGGTGLGLAIVDAVVTAHQGRVSLASRAGSTQFVITLPFPYGGRPDPGSGTPPA
ncbi:MAG TPA: HAMP domain-containing sensor histidine kinase [Streptosporangiaceae bacterium]|jgi:two-component system OmpR family sensor kinase